MLSRLSITLRLLLLILVPVLALVIVGIAALASVQASSGAITAFNRANQNILALQELEAELQSNLLGPVNEAAAGVSSWRQALERVRESNERVDASYTTTLAGLNQISVDLKQRLENNSGVITRSYAQATQALESANPEAVRALLNAGFAQRVQGPIDLLAEATAGETESAQFILDYSRTRSITYMLVNAGLGLSGLIAALILGYYISRSITQPVLNLTQVVSRVAEGDLSSRAHLAGYDEVTQLGDGLDRLLDDKVTTLAQAEEENAQLNDSVIKLLRAVSRLSQRDLTVRVPVTEDVTGPVADAINQLTTETNRVLLDVAEVADQVADASSLVNQKASLVNDAAAAQGKEVTETAEQLAAAAARLGEIAEIARQCNDLASQTTTMTDTAVSSVHSTLSGMNNIREVIQETGKRIKRLGERSQEISGVVDIINRITERTTVLALNASMQAAAAGEAGRGFAVVADEVQRLAESSRNATAQIASLVKSIQVETNDTISTMDQAINQVVEGSKLAEGAGERMNETRASTSALVESVLQIVSSSQEQAELSKYLRDRAEVMLERSTETGREVRDQLEQTNSMAEYAQHLLASVRQFQLAPVG
jgi:methyl-accepting chemotaxis protein